MTAGERFMFERAVIDSDLTSNARLVALVLATKTSDTGLVIPQAFSPSLSKLAKDTGLARRTVTGALNDLESGGWVERHRPTVTAARTEHARTSYVLHLPPGASAPGDGLVQEEHQARAGGALDLVQEVHRPSAPGAHNQPAFSPSFKASSSSSRAGGTKTYVVADVLAALGLDDEGDQRDFIASLNPRSPRGLIRSLEQSGELAGRIADWQLARQAKAVSSPWDNNVTGLGKPSTTDAKVQAALALAARLEVKFCADCAIHWPCPKHQPDEGSPW